MKIRLARGVVASGLGAWAVRPSGPVRLPDGADARPGEAVVLGPEDAPAADVERAAQELGRLVRAGGVVVAGAGVDLGGGFHSARLDGARGDQRDAVLAALRVLGLRGAERLGDRSGFLVALFGPAVTRRVGAAAGHAVAEGRWAALHLAVAASDVLGPEQLEQILALDAPGGADVVPGGLPSVLAEHLRRVFGPLPRPRRLSLILDLWERVLEHHEGLARREKRLATQSKQDRTDVLRRRRDHDDDESILWRLRDSFGSLEPSLADAARWTPGDDYWRDRLHSLLQDALGATALLRTAVAVADHGIEEGAERSADLIRAAAALVDDRAAVFSARRIPGFTGIPSRPAAPVREIDRRLSSDAPRDHRFAASIRTSLTSARAYALLIMEDLLQVMNDLLGFREKELREWAATGLRSWREAVGYDRPPQEWAGIPPWSTPLLGGAEPLNERIAAGQDPADVEVVGDLLWYADMVDALARLHGHERARGVGGSWWPWLDHDPVPDPEPLTPRLDSVTGAVSGAAQLAALGGVPPRGAKTWKELVDGLMAGTAIAEALTGEFAVPKEPLALDGATVPGTGLRVKVARSARDLAEWSDYMGNCIAGPYYLQRGTEGRIVLVGLYDERGRLVANAELDPLRPASRGWRIDEIAGRFNDEADAELVRRFGDWVAAIPGPAAQEPAPVPDEPEPARPARRRAAPRVVEEAGPRLRTLAQAAWDEAAPGTLGVYAALAATPPDAALVRLRRLGAPQMDAAVRRALDAGGSGAGGIDLAGLWEVTERRPLAAALDALDPALRDRFDQLPLLLAEPPLPKQLRRLARLPGVADAYALDLVARRTRRAIGRLAVRDDPAVARSLARRPTEPLLCALIVAVNCEDPGIEMAPVTARRKITVPGYPVTTLEDEDGPWRRALPVAAELGADTSVFWEAIAAHGLRIPASWLGSGGWTALWSRAHSHR